VVSAVALDTHCRARAKEIADFAAMQKRDGSWHILIQPPTGAMIHEEFDTKKELETHVFEMLMVMCQTEAAMARMSG
jgi:hypothetical protein